MICKEN